MSDWISTTEAVELSGYNAYYLRRLIRGKIILAEKKGNAWWVDRMSLVEYIKAAKSADDGRYGAKKTTTQAKKT